MLSGSPLKTPLTPANSLAPTTPVPSSLPSVMTPDAILFEQIRAQFQNQLQLQEHYNSLLAQQKQAAEGETHEELMKRHGFR